MGAVNIMVQIPMTDIPMYIISLFTVSLMGILFVDWVDRKFESFISPLYDRVVKRYEYVQKRNE